MSECNYYLNKLIDNEITDNELVISNKFKHKSLEERAAAYGGKLGPFEEYDWGDKKDGEFW